MLVVPGIVSIEPEDFVPGYPGTVKTGYPGTRVPGTRGTVVCVCKREKRGRDSREFKMIPGLFQNTGPWA